MRYPLLRFIVFPNILQVQRHVPHPAYSHSALNFAIVFLIAFLTTFLQSYRHHRISSIGYFLKEFHITRTLTYCIVSGTTDEFRGLSHSGANTTLSIPHRICNRTHPNLCCVLNLSDFIRR